MMDTCDICRVRLQMKEKEKKGYSKLMSTAIFCIIAVLLFWIIR